MKLVSTTLAVALPCFCTVALALMHVLHLKSTLDGPLYDRVCLSYIYVSYAFYALHSKLVQWLGDFIEDICDKLEPKSDRTYGIISWLGTAICLVPQLASLLAFAYQSVALYMEAESFIAEAVTDDIDLAAWTLSVCFILLLVLGPRQVPSKLMLVRFTVAYLVLLAAPAYIVWCAHYVASGSLLMGKIISPPRAA